MKVKLKTRLWLAWQAFQLKPVDRLAITPYQVANTLRPGDVCDYNRRTPRCRADAKTCVSRTFVTISFGNDDDHVHLCKFHADELLTSQIEKDYL